MRRGVLTGTALQGMVMSVPLGVPIFFFFALAAGSLDLLQDFSGQTCFLLACAGVIHFVFGRY
jgi:TRAP-type mannitol/chloroaromatic compound transport system permease large subunit